MSRRRALRILSPAALTLVFLAGDAQVASAQSSSTSGKPDSTKSQNQTPPQQNAKPRHVITNDDIDAMHAGSASDSSGASDTDTAIFGSSSCDDECAAEAREDLGFGPEREGDWQFALGAARRHLVADTEWQHAYAREATAMRRYCIFQYQQMVGVPPSGNDYQSQVDRAQRQQYVTNMQQMLWQQISIANAPISRMIDDARRLEPVRAMIMSVVSEHLTQSCPQGIDP
jgi:hypothetical protein